MYFISDTGNFTLFQYKNNYLYCRGEKSEYGFVYGAIIFMIKGKVVPVLN
jgi:hypothetical protein